MDIFFERQKVNVQNNVIYLRCQRKWQIGTEIVIKYQNHLKFKFKFVKSRNNHGKETRQTASVPKAFPSEVDHSACPRSFD